MSEEYWDELEEDDEEEEYEHREKLEYGIVMYRCWTCKSQYPASRTICKCTEVYLDDNACMWSTIEEYCPVCGEIQERNTVEVGV